MSTAIITGASRGFGRAAAEAFVERGWAVVLDARNSDDLAQATAGLGHPDLVVAIAGDVADPAHRRALIDATDRLGGLDLLVNNASTLGPSPLPSLDRYPLDALRQVFEVNVLAPLALVQEALPALRRSRGAVVNVTSDAAVEGYEGWGGYGSSKAALDQLGNVLASEEADVRLYRFDPGDMRTQMHQDAFPGEDISDRALPETVVPALLRLVDEAPASGRYRAADLNGAVR
jgi:NAD(P)-dependent dehydrogenase (short-subunit alcohol dehydrogenase family)